jgi:four helix bundle protein
MMFEDLDAWQQARHLVNEICSLTRENSSLSKDFGLTDQLQMAAVSIMSNIAEGFERTHLPEKIQFYNIARGSTGLRKSLLFLNEHCH